MNENQIASVFQLITSIVAIVGGVLFIIFRKRIFEAQKKYLSSRTDYLNRSLNKRFIEMSSEQWNIVSVLASIGVIIAGIVRLIRIL